MNKKSAFYKYAKLYSYLIKEADFEPLPNSGISDFINTAKEQGIPTDSFTKTNPLVGTEYQQMFRNASNAALPPVDANTNILDRLQFNRGLHNEIQNQRNGVQAYHNMRNILMPTFKPEQQEILKQTQLSPEIVNFNTGVSMYVPAANSVLTLPNAAQAAHEFEHVIDYSRRRNKPAKRVGPEAHPLDLSQAFGTDTGKMRYRNEQIANRVPQLRLRRLWGKNLNKDQKAILDIIQRSADISMKDYQQLIKPKADYDPMSAVTALNSLPNINKQINRQAKRQGVYSIAPELKKRYDLDDNGKRITTWNSYKTEAEKAGVNPATIANNERIFRARKSLDRNVRKFQRQKWSRPEWEARQRIKAKLKMKKQSSYRPIWLRHILAY